MKILFSGGGTLGAVMPILTVALSIKKNLNGKIIWVGTKNGPEKEIITSHGIDFKHLKAGKFRRYFSFYNFVDVFKIIIAFLESISLLKKEKPDLLVSTGGYVSVPLHLAAFFLKIPSWIHQQDACVGLANKIMAKMAAKITVSLQNSVDYFDSKKTEWTGNFCRPIMFGDKNESKKIFKINDDEPMVLFVGGSSGAAKLNDLVLESLEYLPKNWHLVHVVGPERSAERSAVQAEKRNNYSVYKFLKEEMSHALFLADVVVTRAGFATLTELSFLEKPSIIIPISDSHQEENANIFLKDKSAIVLDERSTNGKELSEKIMNLINNKYDSMAMGKRMKKTLPIASDEKVERIISEITKK